MFDERAWRCGETKMDSEIVFFSSDAVVNSA